MSPFKRIETGTPEANALGFTEELFSGWIELDEQHKRIYLHYIISRKKNEGNVQKLILSWLKNRYEVRVVMPKEIMRHILKTINRNTGSVYTNELRDLTGIRSHSIARTLKKYFGFEKTAGKSSYRYVSLAYLEKLKASGAFSHIDKKENLEAIT